MNRSLNEHLSGYSAAYVWLARDPLSNLEPLLALLHEPVEAIDVFGTVPKIEGVLLHSPHPWNDGWCYRCDTTRHETLARMLLRTRLTGDPWFVQRPWVAKQLVEEYGFIVLPRHVLGYATAHPSVLEPRGKPLQPTDEPLVVASDCGWTADQFQSLFRNGRRVWAIIEDGRIVCRVSSGFTTPWTSEILGLWTRPSERRRGLAAHLVAAACQEILSVRPLATYTTTNDNLASQGVARKAGFRRVSTTLEYLPPKEHGAE
ncbi:MAG: hypothetical protein NVS4B8_22550 [Herpetosiphon sp.]